MPFLQFHLQIAAIPLPKNPSIYANAIPTGVFCSLTTAVPLNCCASLRVYHKLKLFPAPVRVGTTTFTSSPTAKTTSSACSPTMGYTTWRTCQLVSTGYTVCPIRVKSLFRLVPIFAQRVFRTNVSIFHKTSSRLPSSSTMVGGFNLLMGVLEKYCVG